MINSIQARELTEAANHKLFGIQVNDYLVEIESAIASNANEGRNELVWRRDQIQDRYIWLQLAERLEGSGFIVQINVNCLSIRW